MITVSQHATKRFMQRYHRRSTGWSTESERQQARETLTNWFEQSTRSESNRYIYENFALIVENDTIITILKKGTVHAENYTQG